MLTVALEWKEKKNCFNENKVYLGKFMAFPWHYRLSFCRSNHASLLLNNVIFSSHSLSFFWCWHHLCGLCRTLLKCWTEQASVFYIKMCVESDRERMNLAKKYRKSSVPCNKFYQALSAFAKFMEVNFHW